jgi:hypothetical protein
MPRRDPAIKTDEIMAERRYTVESRNAKKNVMIKIGFPAKRGDDYFECQAEISDEVNRIVRPMRGRDAFEAIFVAISMIGVELIYLLTFPRIKLAGLMAKKLACSSRQRPTTP